MAFNRFEMTHELLDYDVYPKVLVKGKETTVHIRANGRRPEFEPGKEYDVLICALEQGCPDDYPATGSFVPIKTTCDKDCNFAIRYTFHSEQMYFIRFLDADGNKMKQFPVYCVDEDLAGRWPLRGDLHIHTTRSDGEQNPEIVCANYRKYGMDFMVVSDHGRYYPSLEAINFYKQVKNGLCIVPGEEVHMPKVHGQKTDIHIVNFGGEYSINALTDNSHTEDVGTAAELRSITGKCPDYMPLEKWEEKMYQLSEEIDVPDDVDAIPAAVSKWIFDEIRKANGLGIFPHPTWINNVYHVPNAFMKYITEHGYFDAFEVLGGENYYEQNGFQTSKYYEDRAKGIKYPVVGSTDSHSSYHTNRNGFICSTLVFSPENERKSLIRSIKDFYSVAIDTISDEFRLVGEDRFVRYGCFLLKYYFPLHDELCYEEGRLMRQFAIGDDKEKKEASAVLELIGDRVQKHREKFFDF